MRHRGVDDVEASTVFLQAMVLLGRQRFARRTLVVRAGARGPGRGAVGATVLHHDDARLRSSRVQAASPRLYFEETVLPGPRVNAGQAQGYVLCNLGYLARLAGDLDEARILLDEAVSIFRALGDRDGESLALNHLGCLHRVRAEFAEGRAALEQSLRIRHEIGDRRAIGLTLGNLGVLTAAEGDLERGVALLGAGAGRLSRDGGRARTGRLHADHGKRATRMRATTTRRRRLLPDALLESRHIPGNHRATAWGYVMLSDVHSAASVRPTRPSARWLEAGDQFRALGAIDGGLSPG